MVGYMALDQAEHIPGTFYSPTTLLYGPSGGGKSTYAMQHLRYGDALVDWDLLYAALSGQPLFTKPDNLFSLVQDTRTFILNRLCKPHGAPHAYVIQQAPRQRDRAPYIQAGATPMPFVPTSQECIQRIQHDPRRAHDWERWQPIIKQWFTRYKGGYG